MCARKTEVSSKKIMAMTQKERSEKFYRKRKDNGLCPRCGTQLDREGHYCEECLRKIRIYRQESVNFYRENGLCTVCGKEKVFGSERICPECRAKNEIWRKPLTEEQRKRNNERNEKHNKSAYWERKELGICTRCGKRKAMTGKAKCGICLAKDAEMHRKKYFDRPNIREYRINNHLCLYCGDPVAENSKLCEVCLQKCVERGKKNGGKNKYWDMDNRLIFRRK